MRTLDFDGLDGVLVQRIPAPMLIDPDDEDEVLEIVIDDSPPAPLLAGPTRAILYVPPAAVAAEPEPPPVTAPTIAPAPLPLPEPAPLAPARPRTPWWVPALGLAAAALVAVLGASMLQSAEPEKLATAAAVPLPPPAPALTSTVASAPTAPAPTPPAPEVRIQVEGSRLGAAPVQLTQAPAGTLIWTTQFGFDSVVPVADAEIPADIGQCAAVQVIGMACGRGAASANALIAAGRAVATARMLVEAGVAPSAIRLGTDMPADASRAARRRAEVRCISNIGE